MGGSRDTAMVKGSGILGGLRDTGGAPGYRGSGIPGLRDTGAVEW